MSNAYAENELERLEKECDSEDELKMQEEVTKCILDLLDVFEKQEHSGFSASYIINLFTRLAQHKPLSPLTGEDDEWEKFLDTPGHYGQTIVKVDSEPIEGSKYVGTIILS